MARIDYFFSTLSPYTYLSGTRLEEVAARHGASIHYKPMDIVALFGRTGGTPPGQRHVSRQEYRLIDLERQSARTGLKLKLKPAHWPTNAAPSSYAIIAAQEAGGGDMGKLVHGILTAVWAEERDIAEDSVIRDCLSAAGFDPALADSGLLSGADTYAANLEEAVERGVCGARCFIPDDGEGSWGQDKFAELDAYLTASAA
ncbi:MAG: 2-hydroxychromene-2-carboxylate isomerase [Arenibacterium sp.]